MTRSMVFGSYPCLGLLLSLSALGCTSGSDGGVLASPTGQLSIEIHDQPTPEILECWVTIDGVEAGHQRGDWQHIGGAYPHHFDLLQLQNGSTRQLGAGGVRAGAYNRIRLHLTEVRLVLHDGLESGVPLPDGGQWVEVPIGRRCEVSHGEQTHLSLDFRVETSFHRNAGEDWYCDPDIVVDGVRHHHGHPG